MENLFKSFGEETVKIVIKQMEDALNIMNKYSVLPIYIMQFMIAKDSYLPYVVLSAFDNKDLIAETSSSAVHLEDVLHSKLPKTITPAVIVYPEGIVQKDVLVENSDKYYYSSSYLVCGKELKDYIKKGKIDIYGIDLVTDLKKTCIKTELKYKYVTTTSEDGVEDVPNDCVNPIPFTIKGLHLPFSNYVNIVKSFSPIVNTVLNPMSNVSTIEVPKEDIESLFTSVKEEQMINIPGSTNVKVFKDFIKAKPTSMTVSTCCEEIDGVYDQDIELRSVCLELYFKTGHHYVNIFYRYLTGIYETLQGSIDEFNQIQENT